MNDERNKDKPYQGWSNYETWAVALWLDNDRASYECWRGTARELKDHTDGVGELAELLREGVTEAELELGANLYADLLNSAFAAVDWYELAHNYLEDVTENDWPGEPSVCDAPPMLCPERSDGPNISSEPTDENPFGECIFRYTRQQAIEDGVLVEVKEETAKEAGFKIPVAMTSSVWAAYVKVPPDVSCQDLAGRLWDVLWMCQHGIVSGKKLDWSEVFFQLHVRNDNREGDPPLITLKAVCGPDDDGSPCITIMQLDED